MRVDQFQILRALRRACVAVMLGVLLVSGVALGQDKVDVVGRQMDGFGRVVLTFADRFDLPPYQISTENGVLSVVFEEPVDVSLHDVSGSLPAFISVSRIDPDKRGLRFGLKSEVNVNRLEAGGQLYLDFLPLSWQGLAPGLPAEVVAELARRSREAAELAELERRIEFARINNPQVQLQVGRHPTFIRMIFDWSLDTEAEFKLEETMASIEFSWPVDIDLYPLVSDLPEEIISVTSTRLRGSNLVEFELAEGVVPRFFRNSDTRFSIDIDLVNPNTETLSADALLAAVEAERLARETEIERQALEAAAAEAAVVEIAPSDQIELTPQISRIGSTIRIAFPFNRETPAAVFQRGDYLWMVLDTTTLINAPDDPELLSTVSEDFSVVIAGDTQIVRMKMIADRLASLGSQGTGWVLSLGDDLMAPTRPLRLDRRLDPEGRYEIVADVERPVRRHELRDPEIGDVLEVVTLYPPAHGIVRKLRFVDFDALDSVHGLVVKSMTEDLDIALKPREIVISSQNGLTLSSPGLVRGGDPDTLSPQREGFIDLVALEERDPVVLLQRREALMSKAADGVGRARERARLDLATVLLANRLGFEAIGILDLLIEENKVEDLLAEAVLTKAAASIISNRGEDALELLRFGQLAETLDGQMWRAIARHQTRDFAGARGDFLASEIVAETYPVWLQNMFFLVGIESAIETGDLDMARRLMGNMDVSGLTQDEASHFGVLEGRFDEMDQRFDEALDTYGLVIASDVRPARAEAIFRTISLLDRMGKLEPEKAIQTLSRESIVWRGGPIEAKMLELLAKLQFENGLYRDGFATVREASETKVDDEIILSLTSKAQDVFADLYINGAADSMDPVDALSLYYDYRYFTPAGARGDEMIRNLARRLIRVDLLEQAASLLEYQIETRLEGAARSQIAADLAIIYIADHRPADALKVLGMTSLANLPLSLERQRRLLEGRALIDEGRMELALDVLAQMEGRDVDLLRVDAYWQAGLYMKAAEQLELIYSQRSGDTPLSQPARMNIIKAAVGYVLDGDELGLSRLRSKFSERMANSAEWAMFDYVTGGAVQTSADFRDVAAQVAGIDGLSAFLNAYRQTYGADGALAPRAGAAVS